MAQDKSDFYGDLPLKHRYDEQLIVRWFPVISSSFKYLLSQTHFSDKQAP